MVSFRGRTATSEEDGDWGEGKEEPQTHPKGMQTRLGQEIQEI